jgi:hypothetical protein
MIFDRKIVTAIAVFSSFTLSAKSLSSTQLPTITLEGDRLEGSISSGSIRVDGRYQKKIVEEGLIATVPSVTVFVNENPVIVLTGQVSNIPVALVQIAEMDSSNNTPEIILQSYSGGAHCCTSVKIATQDRDSNKWKAIEVGSFDGAPDTPNSILDIDGDGQYEFVTVDNCFLYTFESYAGSVAPPQIWSLQKTQAVDVTKNSKYQYYLRKDLQELWKWSEQNSNKGNGFWAGYVAWKALLGEEIDAWELMLKNYDKSQTYCSQYDRETYDCIGVQEGFPSALRSFLVETGYLKD